MDRLILKPLREKDLEHVMTWVNDPEVVKNFQHFTKKFTRKDELKFIRQILKSKTDFMFSIFRKKDNAYVGQGGIHRISWENKLGRLSMVITRPNWGKGYGQEAERLLIAHAFKKLKLHKIWIVVYASNKKSIHINKKLGFKPEGILRDEYFWRGRYHDMLRMSILTKEFKK